MSKYILISESALDMTLISNGFSQTSMMPVDVKGVFEFNLSQEVVGYRIAFEPEEPIFALIGTEWLQILASDSKNPNEPFRRIARVIKGLRSPPVHLPRQWAEYHYRNLLAFFALPRDISSDRWVADLDGANKCARFDYLYSAKSEQALETFKAAEWPSDIKNLIDDLLSRDPEHIIVQNSDTLVQEADLYAIGSASVVGDRTFEDWERYLTESQKGILSSPAESSIRIVGPAGSGKTLSLCMRAIQVSRDENVIAQGKRILIATHSWAMSERIDGILSTLNNGVSPEGIIVFPLLSLLEMHAGHVGQQKIEVIGNDSSDGRVKSFEIISENIHKIEIDKYKSLSEWIHKAFVSDDDSISRSDLIINLHEEISGILTASGTAPDDLESIHRYISGSREDWMPPFPTSSDRIFVIDVYKLFIQSLVDRSAITTDQFILDSIRILETFTWRMRKETEGYDYIFVDELQLFDPQERSALELLGRSRKGVPFITAEDPSQGVFSALNDRRQDGANIPVYLETVHRFNRQIFEFINFIYQKFPLNAFPLRIQSEKGDGVSKPTVFLTADENSAVLKTAEIVEKLYGDDGSDGRICVVTLGEINVDLNYILEEKRIQITKLTSFDDVEKLSYVKKSVVASPWQYIGGTQFSHVVVLTSGIGEQTSQFGKLREMKSIYLSCSRAVESLNIVCATYVPPVLVEANEQGYVSIQGFNK